MYESMSYVHGINICSFWVMYYFGSKNEDEFVAIAVKLSYLMLTKKMNYITATAIWQESNVFKKIIE